MKKTALFVFTAAALACSNAQNNLAQFSVALSGANEIPANSSPHVGNAIFWLDGTTLNYAVGVYVPMPTPIGATINGPATTNANGAVLFNLGGGFPVIPDGFSNGQNWGWGGGIENLTRDQICDLLAGRWYVNITSSNYPAGELRGQLIPQFDLQFSISLGGANEIPPNGSAFSGTASATLKGNVFSLQVDILDLYFDPTGAFIRGPARQGASGPVVFDLGTPLIHLPFPPVDPGGELYVLTANLDHSQIVELLAGLWYVNITTAEFPNGKLRGQILLPDSDHDGVPDVLDGCPGTVTGAAVDANGCSIAQLCPCEGPWKNHGEYVKRVATVASQFEQSGLISGKQRNAIIQQAAKSGCGQAR